MQTPNLLAIIEAGALPALRIVSIIAVLIFAGAGAYIYRKRHQLFDRDSAIAPDEDGPAVRHIRFELVLIIWGVLMLLMLATCIGIWRS